MHEIKFRAIILAEDEEPKLISWCPDFFSDMSPVTGWGSEFPELNKHVILMQYINLKDCNGIEIYEGDIVKVKSLYDSAQGMVVLHECSWCFKLEQGTLPSGATLYRSIGTGWYGIEVIDSDVLARLNNIKELNNAAI